MRRHKAVVKVMTPRPRGREVAAQLEKVILGLGEDPGREGLLKTPERAAQALEFLTSGYRMSVEKILNGALFTVTYDEMVIVKDIEFFSLCEHHLLPFYGKVHVAYIPRDKVVGLSKIPRIVDMFARRLQLQERMTQQIAQSLEEAINPLGVGVISEARHFCMMMRGVEKQNSKTITSAMEGVFLEDLRTREEFLRLCMTSTILS